MKKKKKKLPAVLKGSRETGGFKEGRIRIKILDLLEKKVQCNKSESIKRNVPRWVRIRLTTGTDNREDKLKLTKAALNGSFNLKKSSICLNKLVRICMLMLIL